MKQIANDGGISPLLFDHSSTVEAHIASGSILDQVVVPRYSLDLHSPQLWAVPCEVVIPNVDGDGGSCVLLPNSLFAFVQPFGAQAVWSLFSFPSISVLAEVAPEILTPQDNLTSSLELSRWTTWFSGRGFYRRVRVRRLGLALLRTYAENLILTFDSSRGDLTGEPRYSHSLGVCAE